jgi:energy-coupling factor transporter ATP-binding protein EcfA2
MSDAAPLIPDLDAALKKIGLHRANDEREWLDTTQRVSYLVPAGEVRMAHHFDLKAAMLVRDAELGTLGIVSVVSRGADRSVADQVREHVDAAAYARHLLLRDPKLGSSLASTVELVLVTADDADTVRDLGTTLRDLLKGTESLFHIGIGVLVHRGCAEPYGEGLRRAFPWLLTATRKWLSSNAAQPRAGAAAHRLDRIVLSDYRLRGKRDVHLASTRVHLLHGPNGSGKSSLVEALELVTAGTIERLDRARHNDYLSVIANRDAQTPPHIELFRNSEASKACAVTKTGVEEPLDRGVRASSFRLDQPLMERLVGLEPPDRARCFLEAFFPEAASSLATYAEATAAREKALAALKQPLEITKSAQQVLSGIADWRGGGTEKSTEDFTDLLNRWLERTALADLARREHHVRATLAEARSASWEAMHEAAVGLLAPLDADCSMLQQQAERWTREAAELQSKLASLRPSTHGEQVRAGQVRSITRHQCEVLNQAGAWLFDADVLGSFGPFGDKVFKVMSAGDTPTYGPIVIGGEAWAASVLSTVEAVIGAFEGLAGGTPPEAWPGKGPCAEYVDAIKQHAAVLDAGLGLTRHFLSVLSKLSADPCAGGEFDGSLVAALNELMALFTPARWGYDDIDLPSELNKGSLNVGISVGSGEDAARGELHLNTAELNLFTVSLFLLCAGRVHKPLKLLILDDPLQNMDELTSTALARGMTKLVRLWERIGRDDELLLLFHGYDDLERFQAELPAAVYRLPWLSPSRAPADSIIRAEPGSRTSTRVQDLAGLFARA